jgi:hypothetical protein
LPVFWKDGPPSLEWIENCVKPLSESETKELVQLVRQGWPQLIKEQEGQPEAVWHLTLVGDVDACKAQHGGKVQRACKFLSQHSARYRGRSWRTLRMWYYANRK